VVLLTTVEASWEITGRGCWITPVELESDLRIREKDRIQLRTPNGHILDTYIATISTGSRAAGGRFLGIGLPGNITPPQVPPGTEIWLVDQQAT
jgi:hypothetical protein